MFNCPNKKCGKKAPRLILSGGVLGCVHCMESRRGNNTGVLHKVRFNKPHLGRMTHAEAMNIKTNKLRSDGTYKPDPRWR